MPSINLLPWRQALRQRRRKEFLFGLGAAVGLAALITLEKPVVRVHYEFEDAGEPTLGSLVDAFLDRPPQRRPKEAR